MVCPKDLASALRQPKRAVNRSNGPVPKAVRIAVLVNPANIATPPTQTTTVNPPQLKVVRVKPIDPAVPKLRFQLSDGSVDLMKAFSLGGFEGVGGAWNLPPTEETFDAR